MRRSQQNTAVNVDDCRYHTAASLAQEVEFQVPVTSYDDFGAKLY